MPPNLPAAVLASATTDLGHLLEAGRAPVGVLPVSLPGLVQPDPPVGEQLRGADAAAGDDPAVGADHAVREVDRAVRLAGAGQRAAPHLAPGELAPHEVAILPVQRDRCPAVGVGIGGAEP